MSVPPDPTHKPRDHHHDSLPWPPDRPFEQLPSRAQDALVACIRLLVDWGREARAEADAAGITVEELRGRKRAESEAKRKAELEERRGRRAARQAVEDGGGR